MTGPRKQNMPALFNQSTNQILTRAYEPCREFVENSFGSFLAARDRERRLAKQAAGELDDDEEEGVSADQAAAALLQVCLCVFVLCCRYVCMTLVSVAVRV